MLTYEEYVRLMVACGDGPGFCPIDGIWTDCNGRCVHCECMKEAFADEMRTPWSPTRKSIQRELQALAEKRESLRKEAEAAFRKSDFVLCWAWCHSLEWSQQVVICDAHSVDEVLAAFDDCQRPSNESFDSYEWVGIE